MLRAGETLEKDSIGIYCLHFVTLIIIEVCQLLQFPQNKRLESGVSGAKKNNASDKQPSNPRQGTSDGCKNRKKNIERNHRSPTEL